MKDGFGYVYLIVEEQENDCSGYIDDVIILAQYDNPKDAIGHFELLPKEERKRIDLDGYICRYRIVYKKQEVEK